MLARIVVREVLRHNFLGRASELAFDFLFALFPLMLFMFGLIGLFTSQRSELQGTLLSYFAVFLPPAAFQLFNQITNELAAHSSGGKITLGIILALVLASGGISSMIDALNGAYRVRETRSWIWVRTIALALTLAMSVLLLSALVLVLLSSEALKWLAAELLLTPLVGIIGKGLEWPVAIAFVVMAYALIYYCGPNLRGRRWHWITPGSLCGAMLWLATSAGFRIYLHFFNTYSTTYGSLGAVMILLVWLYVTGLSFLIGGVINAEIERAGGV
jgi:membrane protein